MATNGIDVSTPLTATKAQEFFNEGRRFVGRYLVPLSWSRARWKALTVLEAKIISDAGLWIVSIWETTANAAGNGSPEGKLAAIDALIAAKEVGQPQGTKIYFAIDFEPKTSQYDAIAAYFSAIKQVIGNTYIVDAYGCKAILDYLKGKKLIPHGFQTIAWSYKQKSENISIFQKKIDIQICSVNADDDESYGNEGWWSWRKVVVVDPPKPPVIKQEGQVIPMTPVPGQPYKFLDIDNHWALADIEKLDALGLLSHPNDQLFNPDKPMTRGETAAMFSRLLDYLKS